MNGPSNNTFVPMPARAVKRSKMFQDKRRTAPQSNQEDASQHCAIMSHL
jgi:hypothetical protein